MTPHLGSQFSTLDKDNDPVVSYDCSEMYRGAWWYGIPGPHCHASNLNGIFYVGPMTSYGDGVNWYTWGDYSYSYKSEMKIKPLN